MKFLVLCATIAEKRYQTNDFDWSVIKQCHSQRVRPNSDVVLIKPTVKLSLLASISEL